MYKTHHVTINKTQIWLSIFQKNEIQELKTTKEKYVLLVWVNKQLFKIEITV